MKISILKNRDKINTLTEPKLERWPYNRLLEVSFSAILLLAVDKDFIFLIFDYHYIYSVI